MVEVRSSLILRTIPVLLAVCLFNVSARAKYSGGTGEPNDPYQIATAVDLITLGETPADYGKHFILTADIDLDPNLPGRKVFDRAVIAPDVNDAQPNFRGHPFVGVFDGNGHSISHLIVVGKDFVGLFGHLGQKAEVRNLGVVDLNVTGSGEYGGGLAGFNGGGVENCYSSGILSGTRSSVGGLVGGNSGSISTSYSTALVTSATGTCVGGLVGLNTGSITTSHSTGGVSGTSTVGGLVGENYQGSIAACCSTGSVRGTGSHVGGLVGRNGGSISASYSSGWVNGGAQVGGLAGWNIGSIVMSYSTGVVGGRSEVGGLVGFGGSWVIASFWDTQTSGQVGNTGGTGLTTAQMQQINTFLDAGWDLVGEAVNGTCDYWQISSGDYPRLRYHAEESPVMPEGLGTAEKPYLIRDARDLGAVWFEPTARYRLEASLDLSGITWSTAVIPWFAGTFDGGGHTISHLTIHGVGYLGLFGQVGSGGEVRDVGVVDVNITGSNGYVGGLVGFNWGNVTSCYSTGAVKGNYYIGGLVACNQPRSVASDCYSTAVVGGSERVGGLVAHNNSGSMTRCYSTGRVSGTPAGGLVGTSDGVVADCFWDTQTSGLKTSAAGTGKTTAQMQMAATFFDWGKCGNERIWMIDEGNDYPRLAWEHKAGSVLYTRLSDFVSGTGSERDPYLIYTASDLDTIAKFPCEQNKHFKLMFLTGEGTQENPYLIYTAAELNLLGGCRYELGRYFRLMADIDLSGFDGKYGRPAFNGIAANTGQTTDLFQGTPFTGVFDGNGHIISHLTVRGGSYLGLFGSLGSGAEVKDLGLVDVSIAGSGHYVGGLAGYSGGTVTQCYSTGAVGGVWYVGGLLGWNARAVTYCYSTAQVTGAWGVGGLVGENYATVTRCYSAGKVSSTGQYIGGFIGYGGRATNCFWDTQTSGRATSSGGAGKTTAEMKTAATFLQWAICNEGAWAIDDGNDYPRLAWEHKPGQVLDIRLSDSLAGTGTQDDPYLIHTAEELATIARFPCEQGKRFRLVFLTGEGTPEVPYLVETAEQIDLLNQCPYERTAHFRLRFVPGDGSTESPYVIETAEQINLLNRCPYERDAKFRLGFVTGEGTENDPYLICTADQIELLRMCPYEQGAHFKLGFAAGEGTQDSPYLIYTADELNLVGMCPYERDGHFKIMADIDLSAFDGKDGRPAFDKIGDLPWWEPSLDVCFTGVFDGNDHTISNLSHTCTQTYNVGLFGCVSGPNSVVKNLTLTSPDIDAGEGSGVGALVGYLAAGAVVNCHVEGGRVSGASQIGGLVGTNYQGTITDCNSTATVSGNGSIGGLAGSSQGTITHCDTAGHVLGNDSVGGLVGSNSGTISHCDSAGRILGDYDVGGLVGTNNSRESELWPIGAVYWEEPGMIHDCYSTAAVLGTGSNCGGLVGGNYAGEIARCCASGIVLGADTVGGFAGLNQGVISNCYSTTDIAGGKNVGGLVGSNTAADEEGSGSAATISGCYATGIVLGDEYAGGLVGEGGVNDVVASFWDVHTSGQATSSGGAGRTTAEMQTASTFLDAGWDFVGETANGTEDLWWILEGKDYPRLWWEAAGEPPP